MAAPTFRGIGAYGSGTTSFTAAVPTADAPVAGDLLLIIMESTDSSTAAGTPSTPANWTKIFEQTFGPGATNVSTLTIFAKIAGAGEANVTVNGVLDHCSGSMLAIAGHGVANVATDIVVGTAANHGTGTSGLSTPSITVTADSMIVLAVGFTDDAADTTNISGVTNANLAGITERRDQTVSTAAGGGVGIYTATCAGTTTGNTTWAHDTAAQSESLHLGIKPGVAAIVGTLAVTLGTLTLSSAATADVQGALTVTLGALTVAGGAVVEVQGIGAATLEAMALVGTGEVTSGAVEIVGTLAVTLDAMSVTGDADAFVQGSGSSTLEAMTASGSAQVAVAGGADAALSTMTLVGAGAVDLSAILSVQLGALGAAGAGKVATSGALSKTLATMGLTASGTSGGAPPAGGEHSVTWVC